MFHRLPGQEAGNNYICNPGFEIYDECPSRARQIDRADCYYTIFGTSDFFHACSDSIGYYYEDIDNIYGAYGTHFPFEGEGMAGAFIWANTIPHPVVRIVSNIRGREYIHGTLDPDISEGYYQFSLRIKLISDRFNVNNLGVFFSDTLVTFIPDTNYYDLSPQIEFDKFLIRNEWVQLSGCTYLSGSEQYFVLGGFRSDEELDVIDFDSTIERSTAYCLFDNLELTRLDEIEIEELNTTICRGDTLYAQDMGYKYDHLVDDFGNESSFIIAENNTTTELGIESCGSLARLNLTVEDCRLNNSVFAPSAFSPNDDGINDYWEVFLGEDIQLIKRAQVYDRWGQIIAQWSNTLSVKWDGRASDKPLDTGVYIYVLEYIDGNGDHQLLTGDITLLK